MKRLIIRYKKIINIALFVLLLVAIIYGVLSWLYRENLIFNILRDIFAVLTLSISLTINFTLNINIDKSRNINVTGNLITGESQEEIEVNKAIKFIGNLTMILEELYEKIEMKHLITYGNFIPRLKMSNELKNISLSNLKEINSELNALKLIIKDEKMKSLIEMVINKLNVISYKYSELLANSNIPVGNQADKTRKEILELINNDITVIRKELDSFKLAPPRHNI